MRRAPGWRSGRGANTSPFPVRAPAVTLALMATALPSITCPECGVTSYHPGDIEQGYCGRCHAWTSRPIELGIEDVEALANLAIQGTGLRVTVRSQGPGAR